MGTHTHKHFAPNQKSVTLKTLGLYLPHILEQSKSPVLLTKLIHQEIHCLYIKQVAIP